MTMLRNRKLGFTKISKSLLFKVLLNVFNWFLCQKFSEKQTLQSYPLETLKGGPIAGCLTELRVPRDRVASDKFIDTAKMFQLSGVCLPDTILFWKISFS